MGSVGLIELLISGINLGLMGSVVCSMNLFLFRLQFHVFRASFLFNKPRKCGIVFILICRLL